jgi:hypothetical protein
MVQLESNKQKLKGSAINHTHQSRPGQHAMLVGLRAATHAYRIAAHVLAP